MVEHSNVGVGEMMESENWWIIATLESEKRWSRRNVGVGETLESEKWWTF
jgi:hypothetical protein